MDDLNVLVCAAVLLVTAGGQGGRVGLSQRVLQFLSWLWLHVWFHVPGPGRGLTVSSWGMVVLPGSHKNRVCSSRICLEPGVWWFYVSQVHFCFSILLFHFASISSSTCTAVFNHYHVALSMVTNVEVWLMEVREGPGSMSLPQWHPSPSFTLFLLLFIFTQMLLWWMWPVKIVWWVVARAGCVAFDVAWVQLQDLCWLLHEVMAWDPSGWAQQLLPRLVLIDDHIACGVTTSSCITLCSNDSSSLHRMDGAYGFSVQWVRVNVVRRATWGIVHYVVVGLGPAGSTTKKLWCPVMRKDNTQESAFMIITTNIKFWNSASFKSRGSF